MAKSNAFAPSLLFVDNISVSGSHTHACSTKSPRLDTVSLYDAVTVVAVAVVACARQSRIIQWRRPGGSADRNDVGDRTDGRHGVRCPPPSDPRPTGPWPAVLVPVPAIQLSPTYRDLLASSDQLSRACSTTQ